MADTALSPLVVDWTHEPEPAAAGQIRRAVRALLAARGVARERADDALTVVEELVVNVLDHARTRFRLVVRLRGGVLHLAVRDEAGAVPDLRPLDPRAKRGRGLQLVAGLADRWGCEPHPDGKTVWAELRV